MWIRGNEVIKTWDITPIALWRAIESGRLKAWDTVSEEPFTDFDLLEAIVGPYDPMLPGYKPETASRAAIDACFKKEQVIKVLSHVPRRKSPGVKLGISKVQDIEALKACLYQLEGSTWREIAQELWPDREYENGNSTHTLVHRRLQRGQELIKSSIEQSEQGSRSSAK